MRPQSLFALVALPCLTASPPLHAEGRAPGITPLPAGPWGTLEYYEVPLECPSEYLEAYTVPSQQTEWRFKGSSRNELESILAGIGFDAPQVASLIRDATVMANSNTLRVFPDHETVLDMPFAMRTDLYRYLATQPGNEHFRRPIYINSENLSEWFDGSLVPRPAIEDIAKLAFPTPRGRGYYLCDLPFTLRQANSAAEERQLIQGLLRSRAMIVRIRLSQDMPLAEIASYWRADYKNKAVLPILESALMADESLALDITHLLPATPRQYLNCFPTLADGIKGRFPDWFWTCYNFFQFTPVDVYADSPEKDALIQSEFTPTLPPLQFGDMLLLNSGPKAIHGCIYIADDIVFTKNGADLFSPWVLMNLGDVVAHHDRFGDVTISAHRRISSDESGTP